MPSEHPESRRYPLYETTLALHRLSPLFIGNEAPLNNAALQLYAKQLRDILAGDLLRGVRIGHSENNVLAQAGALQTVSWKLLPHENLWTEEDESQLMDNKDSTMSLEASRGMLVTITYETKAYKAILLRDTQPDQDESRIGVGQDDYGFRSLPLLLTKMPIGLRDIFVDFLATTFDTRVSVLHLSSAYLMTAMEQYHAYICIGEDGDPLDPVESSRALRMTIGAVTVQVGFDIQGRSGALKTIDIQIAREDLPRIISRGKKLDGTACFADALATYVKAHLALDLRHKLVKIVRISCDAFALGSEGMAKFTLLLENEEGKSSQRRATMRLINGLMATAKGGVLSAGKDGV